MCEIWFLFAFQFQSFVGFFIPNSMRNGRMLRNHKHFMYQMHDRFKRRQTTYLSYQELAYICEISLTWATIRSFNLNRKHVNVQNAKILCAIQPTNHSGIQSKQTTLKSDVIHRLQRLPPIFMKWEWKRASGVKYADQNYTNQPKDKNHC